MGHDVGHFAGQVGERLGQKGGKQAQLLQLRHLDPAQEACRVKEPSLP